MAAPIAVEPKSSRLSIRALELTAVMQLRLGSLLQPIGPPETA
jgi:hypothetical protein